MAHLEQNMRIHVISRPGASGHRPAGERDAAERYREPNLFTVLERSAVPSIGRRHEAAPQLSLSSSGNSKRRGALRLSTHTTHRKRSASDMTKRKER